MSGLELQGRLNASRSGIPTIVMTAFDDPGVRARARTLGCVAYFDKSANAGELLRVIRSFLPQR
jgi:DNA-binding response OmpR family regulator